uniref:tRNase Z endonuclease domain-containing protein n=1 Tax=Rhodymenia pseudopalmata TaxID=31502 RepID=A0A1C9C7M9_RHOPU|nr:hypothetical protein Rhodyp_117 [Rhodymenia pseudopalmata]AOM64395.1 hypothetical protein Rhodyp_117 [Rhodymenia pseudopalmata]
MKIDCLYNKNMYGKSRYSFFSLRLIHSKEIWLFNCGEGCQNYCIQEKIKISQISKIIITELKVNNVSGLIGLLSSLSLIKRRKSIRIYGPEGIERYLSLIKQYSKTKFKYDLYIFTLTTGAMISIESLTMYAFINFIRNQAYDFALINDEKQIKLDSCKAKKFKIRPGPLCGQLKKCFNFILPDGTVLNGNKFIEGKQEGNKFVLISNKYHVRQLNEITNQCSYCYLLR